MKGSDLKSSTLNRRIVIVLCALVVGSCARIYYKEWSPSSGVYSERHFSTPFPRSFISINSSGKLSRSTCLDLAWYRATEIGLEKGFKWIELRWAPADLFVTPAQGVCWISVVFSNDPDELRSPRYIRALHDSLHTVVKKYLPGGLDP